MLEARLTSADPLLGGANPYHLWEFSGDEGRRIHVIMTSRAVSPGLILQDPDGQEVVRDVGTTRRDKAEFSYTLRYTGTYRLAALTMEPRIGSLPTGRYELSVRGLSGSQAVAESGLIVTRLQDVEVESRPPAKDSFGPGEAPILYVYGYGGETVTLVIMDLQTGRTVEQATEYVTPGTNSYRAFELAAGTYRAEVRVSGVTRHSAIFSVRR